MKKLLVALVATTMVSSAFAAGKSMIRLDGCFDGQCDTLDFRMSDDDVEDNESKVQNLALNYAMSFAGNWGAGLSYMQMSETTDGDVVDAGDKSSAITISGYYNIDGSWTDSCFVGLHYMMTDAEDSEAGDDDGYKTNTITLEYGHRYGLGSLMGVTWNWSPSVSYAMATEMSNNDDNDDVKSTDLRLNVANMAVTF